jgi:hypothetical protein
MQDRPIAKRAACTQHRQGVHHCAMANYSAVFNHAACAEYCSVANTGVSLHYGSGGNAHSVAHSCGRINARSGMHTRSRRWSEFASNRLKQQHHADFGIVNSHECPLCLVMIRHFDITRHQADHGATCRPLSSPLAVRNKDQITRCRLIEACEASNPKIAWADKFAP